MQNNIIFKRVKEHIEVLCNNTFLFSADNETEAQRELLANISTVNHNSGVYIC